MRREADESYATPPLPSDSKAINLNLKANSSQKTAKTPPKFGGVFIYAM
jgi:hypothetical protein